MDRKRPPIDEGTWVPDDPELTSPDRPGPAPRAQHPPTTPARPGSTPSAERTIPVAPEGSSFAPESSTPGTSSRDGSGDWEKVPPPVFEPGNIVFGKYKLIEPIGEGGMGQVWLVDNIELERKSALKLIKSEIAKNDKAWGRFRREAQVMAKLEHPNAVAVYDFRRIQSVAYIEMEYVRGRSLDRLIEENGGEPLPPERVLDVLEQLCSVLQEAHGHVDENTGKPRPIIHRDLKPSNLMLVDRKGPGKDLKVLDFGIAKMVDDDRDSHLTGDAEYLGTAAYSSPEQIRGAAVDGRSDLYSTGVLLYQLLTGHLPFEGGRRASLAAHLTQAAPRFREVNPEVSVPAEVERLVLSCLEKDADDRPRSARELAERFRAAVAGRVRTHPAPRPVVRILAGIGLLTILGLGAYFGPRLLRPAPTPTPEPRPPVVAAPAPEAGKGLDLGKLVPIKPVAALPEGYQLRPSDGGPRVLVRVDDQTRYVDQGDGIFLPEGYEPETRGEGWPAALIRTADKARFVRIPGGVYRRGSIGGDVVEDREGNPIVPHWVEVGDFYLQETEVTNGEIREFIRRHQGQFPTGTWDNWQAALDLIAAGLNNDTDLAETYPAVCIDVGIAREYARSVNGLLPTEAQWEYAARSRGKERIWATRHQLGDRKAPRAHLSSNLQGNNFQPVPVKTFRGDDETEDGLFDMTGNVREWCRDVYRPYESLAGLSADDPKQPLRDPWSRPDPNIDEAKQHFIVRGGSMYLDPEQATTYQRDAVEGGERPNDLGFRVAIECPPRLGP